MLVYVFITLLSLTATSCRFKPAMPPHSIWSGSVDLKDGVSVPFQMELDFYAPQPTGSFLVGDERTPIPEISRADQSVTLGFSEYGAEVRASWDGRRLNGNYLRIRSDETKSFPFTAVPETAGSSQERPGHSGKPPDGTYAVRFQDDKGADATVAKFWSQSGVIYGTFIAPDGDYGLLRGTTSDHTVQLSRFTGWQAIAIVLELKDGAWSGAFHAASNSKARSFALRPAADAQIEVPATKRTLMKNPAAEFAFTGVSLSRETVRHTDEQFKGKALIVDIMGTWCHNCLDEAPVLQRIQEKFGNAGLEVVGLSFEVSSDANLARKNLQLYKDRFHLTYPLLFCGSADDDNVKKQIESQLDNFFAYPTTIFIDKNHKVTSIHSGFRGPGTGSEFESQVREFEELARKLAYE